MFSDLVELYRLTVFVLLHGGWIIFAWALLYMIYWLYLEFIQIRWYDEQEWVFLKIVAPRENEKSPLAFEQIFNQLHSIHATFTWPESYIEGQFQIWFTWEITSIGGAIGNYVRVLKKHRDTIEAAIYSQFPNAEISETEDYFEKLPKYNTDTSPYGIFAYNMISKQDNPYPIRTYIEFEHSAADTFVDPATGLWEELGKLNPYEMFVVQYIFRPIDDKWKEHGYELVKKLKGEPEGHGHGQGLIVDIVNRIVGEFLDFFIRSDAEEHGGGNRTQDEPPSLMLHKSEGEKAVIAAVERKLSKLTYETKIRHLYISPREKFNPSPVYTAVIGAIKSVGSSAINSIKPDTDHWTKVKYWMFKEWEEPITDLRRKYRERHFMHMITHRWFFHGPHPFIMNSEEIATILHFPQLDVKVPQIETVAAAKVQPPPELPTVQ